MSTVSKRTEKMTDDHMDLIRRFPLRPIRTWEEYEHAGEVLIDLVSRADDPGLTPGESDYTDVLGDLVRKYDEQHSSLLKNQKKTPPLEILRHIVKETGMNTVSLGKLVGGSGQASLILQGKRELSKANIRKLAEHFHVSPALFI